MGPVKFDDIPKTASEVLNDDYKTSGYDFKTKLKTSWDGAVISTAVDLWPAKDSCMTPAKLTWKLPTPLGFSAICIDKLEMDKNGGLKVEAVTDKVYPGLKVKCTSDLKDVNKITAGCTYTGLKDTQLILDTKAMSPQDFTCEVTHTQGPATCGLKLTAATLTSPDLGVRYASGPLFASLLAKEKFGSFAAACHYKVSSDIRCAACYTYGGKADGNFALGMSYAMSKDLMLKAKVQHDKSITLSAKNTISKGFSVLSGCKYDASGKFSYGLTLSAE